MQEFFSARRNASSSTCTLWVTVSMAAICLVLLYTPHCVASLIEVFAVARRVCIPVFISECCDQFCTFLHVWNLLRVCMQVWNWACSEVMYSLVTCATLVGLCDFLCMVFLTVHVCSLFVESVCVSVCVCLCVCSILLQAWFVFSKYAPVSLCVSVCMCVYNPRPFNSTTWIHPISWSPWLPGPLITEGPGRSNRCAPWRCLSSTTVARNLCWTQGTGACRRQWKPAGAQKRCLDVPVWTGVCVRSYV